MDVTKLFEIMQTQENFTCGDRGATGEEIAHLEKTLGIELPDSYVTFLKTFKFAWWFGRTIYGVSDDKEEDALTITLKARNRNLPEDFEPLPRNGLIISTYGGGGDYFLYAKGSPRSGEVVLLLDETGGHEADSWPSFEDCLAYFLRLDNAFQAA